MAPSNVRLLRSRRCEVVKDRTLGALVANLVDADAYVILTDQRGLFSADPRKDPAARLIEEFRWMIQEFKVSLFAQELKTPVPVSVKRLTKLWQTVRR